MARGGYRRPNSPAPAQQAARPLSAILAFGFSSGADVERAVIIAMKLDVNTGEVVQIEKQVK